MISALSRLCLGTAALGLPNYGLHSGRQSSHREAMVILRAACDAGIRWFDTAAAYGEAEDLCIDELRDELHGDNDSVNLVTKVGCECYQSGLMRRLEEDKWRCVLVHNPLVPDFAGYVFQPQSDFGPDGASVYTPDEALAAIKAGVSYLQIPYHVLDQRHRNANIFVEAKVAGVTVMARQPWCRGLLLTDPNTLRDRGFNAQWWRAIIVYQRICREHGFSPLEAGLRFSMESPADLVVFGVSSLEQLREVIQIAETDPSDSWRACYQELRMTFKDSALTLASVCTPQGR